jgi:hypothetical protein
VGLKQGKLPIVVKVILPVDALTLINNFDYPLSSCRQGSRQYHQNKRSQLHLKGIGA